MQTSLEDGSPETEPLTAELAPVRASESVELGEATCQELALELLRRCAAVDGKRVYRDLVDHRALWLAVAFGPRTERIVEEATGRGAPTPGGLSSLRALVDGTWSGDRLWIIARSMDALIACEHLAAGWRTTKLKRHLNLSDPAPLASPPAFALEITFAGGDR